MCAPKEPPHLTYLRERWLEEHPSLASDQSDSGSGSEEEGVVNPILLDPTQWKEQDHYAILGLSKQRYRATAEDIKKACECRVTASGRAASVGFFFPFVQIGRKC